MPMGISTPLNTVGQETMMTLRLLARVYQPGSAQVLQPCDTRDCISSAKQRRQSGIYSAFSPSITWS